MAEGVPQHPCYKLSRGHAGHGCCPRRRPVAGSGPCAVGAGSAAPDASSYTLEADDRKHQTRVLDALRKREHESAGDRTKRERRASWEKQEEEDTLDNLMRVFSFTLVERHVRDGRPMIVVAFAPRPDAAPRTDDGKLMKKVKGRAWVSEPDYEVARVEFEMLQDVSLGVILGKLYKGTTASVERCKVDDEVWLPAEARFNGSGRPSSENSTLRASWSARTARSFPSRPIPPSSCRSKPVTSHQSPVPSPATG